MFRSKRIVKPVEFDWNEFNKEKNWHKHKVDFRECEEVFSNRPLKTYHDVKHSQNENRFAALGITYNYRRLYLVFAVRKNKIRIISARDMSRKERNLYEKK